MIESVRVGTDPCRQVRFAENGGFLNQTIRAFVLGALIFVTALIPPVILLMDTFGY